MGEVVCVCVLEKGKRGKHLTWFGGVLFGPHLVKFLLYTINVHVLTTYLVYDQSNKLYTDDLNISLHLLQPIRDPGLNDTEPLVTVL